MRKRLAFLVAPAIVPLLFLPFFLFFLFPGSSQGLWIGSILATVFSYLGTLVLGGLGYSLFVPRGYTSQIAASLYGAICGILVAELFLLLFAIAFDGFVAGLKNFLDALFTATTFFWALMSGSVGFVVGNVFWRIARPDRPS